LSSVVLPAPKKPESTVTGSFFIWLIQFSSNVAFYGLTLFFATMLLNFEGGII